MRGGIVLGGFKESVDIRRGNRWETIAVLAPSEDGSGCGAFRVARVLQGIGELSSPR